MSVISFNGLEKKVKKIKLKGFVIYKGNTPIFKYLKKKSRRKHDKGLFHYKEYYIYINWHYGR